MGFAIVVITIIFIIFIYHIIEAFRYGSVSFGILFTVISLIVSILGGVVTVLFQQEVISPLIISNTEAEIEVVNTQALELCPINKGYYVAINHNVDGAIRYEYAYPADDSRKFENKYFENVCFDYLSLTDEQTPRLEVWEREFINPTLNFFSSIKDEYHFVIPENSLLNLGIPVI